MKVVLLGSGNVATHLGRALQDSGHEILQVWSRTLSNAEKLAGIVSADYTDNFKMLNPLADIYIISVKDDAIEEVASSFLFPDKLVVHTSGTADLNLLGRGPNLSGVFYPLQTFSKEKPVDFREIPILVEGNNETATNLLDELARSISQTVQPATSAQRSIIHISAVFACNFSNHLYSISKSLLEKEGLNFQLLLPLIAETASKVQNLDPVDAQTGPAARNDQETIRRHKRYLETRPELLELYSLMTESILRSKYK